MFTLPFVDKYTQAYTYNFHPLTFTHRSVIFFYFTDKFSAIIFLFCKMSKGSTIPHYKLIYFPIRGRGECIRYIFAAADVPYEEELIDFATWPTVKGGTVSIR